MTTAASGTGTGFLGATGGARAGAAAATLPAGYTGTAKANTNTPVTNPSGGTYDATGAYKYPTSVALNKYTDASGNPIKPVTRATEAGTINTGATDLYLNNQNAFTPTQGADTTAYYNQMRSMANAGTPLTGAAQDSILGLMNQGGMAGQAQPSAISDYLTNYANGSQIGGNNEALNRVLDQQDAKTSAEIGLQASMGGRYGSGAYQGLLGNTLAANRDSTMAQQYNQDVANQMTAAQALSGEQQSGVTNRLNANNLGLQATNAAPSIYQFQQAPAGILGTIGTAQDAYQTALKQAPVNALNNYAGIYAATRNPTQGTQQQQSSSGLQQGLGVATGVAGLLGSIF